MGENNYKWILAPGCLCSSCVEEQSADVATYLVNHQPTDKELADAVRKSVQAMSSAVWAARSRGITVDFNVQPEGSFMPVRAIPGTISLDAIYREKAETVPASTKTVRVNL